MRVWVAFACLVACSHNQSPTVDAAPSDASNDVFVGDGNPCTIQPSATIKGTFLGATLNPKDAISLFAQTSQYEVIVAVTDYAGRCPYGNDTKAGSNVLAIVYQSATPLTLPTTFDLSQTKVVFAQYTQFDGTCASVEGESASVGTVTYDTIDACGITGKFDLTFNTDHVTGTFSAPICNNPPDGGAGSCK